MPTIAGFELGCPIHACVAPVTATRRTSVAIVAIRPRSDREVGVRCVDGIRRQDVATHCIGRGFDRIGGRTKVRVADAVGADATLDGMVLVGCSVKMQHRHGLRRLATR